MTAAQLGRMVRHQRVVYKLPMATLAREIGWERQRLAALEGGKSVSTDVRAWVLLGERLGFGRKRLLTLAWETAKEAMPVRLPPPGDPLREQLIDLLIAQHTRGLRELP